MENALASTRQKALALNLDRTTYGTFAEIGGGQEVARWFFNQLAEYLAGYTDGLIGIAVGLPALRQVADEKYYADLSGGMLESMGRLFKRSVKMYVYPTRDPASGQIQSVEQAWMPPPWHHLHALLLELGRIEPIRGYDESCLSIRPPDVLARIQSGDPSWEQMVPAAVAEIVKAEHLFGWQPARELSTV